MVIASYCEGDITFNVYDNLEDYNKEVKRVIEFYENY